MKNYTQFLESTINEGKGPYDYGCAMLYLDAPGFTDIHKMIDPADLHENGAEEEPHITLLYGLHSDEISDDDVFRACEMESCPVRLHNPSLFENDDYDVLKFDAEAPALQIANSRLVKFPHTNKFPDYHPHATIAYLKPGTGKKYTKLLAGQTILAEGDKIVYSKPSGKKIEKKLTSAEN